MNIKSDINMKSDPAFNSDNGYMLGRSSEVIEKEVTWHNNLSDKLDPDIIDTRAHVAQQEDKHGKWKWTPEFEVDV